MISGCVNLYGQGNLLKQTLPALRRVVDYLIVIEGPYADFSYKEVMTPDDLVFIHALADTVISKPCWNTEIEKRNVYLRLVPRRSYAFIVDADEEVVGQLPRGLTADAYRIPLYEKGKLKNNLLRLIKKTLDLEIRDCHNYYWQGETLLNQIEWPILSGIHLNHLLDSTKGRKQAKADYYQRLRAREKPYREKYGE